MIPGFKAQLAARLSDALTRGELEEEEDEEHGETTMKDGDEVNNKTKMRQQRQSSTSRFSDLKGLASKLSLAVSSFQPNITVWVGGKKESRRLSGGLESKSKPLRLFLKRLFIRILQSELKLRVNKIRLFGIFTRR